MARIFTWLKEHPLVLFFLLAYAISWMIWLPQIASVQGYLNKPVSPYLHLLGGIGPMSAAIIVTGFIGGGTGLRDFIRRMFHWRAGITWHLIAWLGPVVLFAIATVIVRMIWGAWPDVSRFGQTDEYPQLPLLVYWVANIVFYGWGEETGWRGFALPRLQKRHGALAAIFVLSIFWALWHLPLFWFIDSFMKMGFGGAMGWYFSMLLGTVLLTWLYNSSQGSILIVAIFHGVMDIVFTFPSSAEMATTLGMLMTLWGIIVLLVYKPAARSHAGLHVIESMKGN
jgi:uncharacterized protein